VLTVAGFRVDLVPDGYDALQRLEEHLPDLVVLDLGLPRVSGLSVAEEIAAQARSRRVPIVIVSGDPGELAETDMLCILRKPIDPDVLLKTVQRCLQKVAGPNHGRRRTDRRI
jgi:DNA-binding response OmpR family regulator